MRAKIMAPVSACVLALFLGAHLASAAAAAGNRDLRDVLFASQYPASTSSSSTKDGSKASAQEHEEYGHIVEKEVCLQETKKKYCGTLGATWNAYIWTSEFACCSEPEYDSYHNSNNGFGEHLRSTQNNIGSCDWSYTPAGATITTNIARIGMASAVCYFGPEADACGGPMCERLMMSLEGSIYQVQNVYTYYGESNTNDAQCQAINMPWGARVAPQPAQLQQEGEQDLATTLGRQGPSAVRRAHGQPAAEAAPESTAAAATAPAAGLEYYSGDKQDKTVYQGNAVIVTGMVTAFAGQRKEKWDEGTFEYTVDYDLVRTVTSGLDASYPWVRDKTYKFTFLKHVHSSY